MCDTGATPATLCLRSAHMRSCTSQQSSGPIARASVDRHFSGYFPHAIDRATCPPATARLSLRRGTGPLGVAQFVDCRGGISTVRPWLVVDWIERTTSSPAPVVKGGFASALHSRARRRDFSPQSDFSVSPSLVQERVLGRNGNDVLSKPVPPGRLDPS